MLKYAVGLVLLAGMSVPVRAGELDGERSAQTTPAAAARYGPSEGIKVAGGGSEMDREAFQQDWGFWRPWGWGFGRPFYGWGWHRPWGYGGWGWGFPAYRYAWGFPAYGWGWGYPAYGWGYGLGYCW
jgi:hypothetical protein